MFDLTSGGPRHPFHDRTAAPVVVSVLGHAVILTLVLIVPVLLATDTMPSVPTMMAFVVTAPPSPPPPPPPPPSRRAEKAVPARPQPTPTGAFAAPVEAPSEVRPEPLDATASGEGEGGVEGGIEGGVAGGIVGSLVAAPLPPPPPPAPAPVKAAGPVRIGGAIEAPTLLKRVEPIYPNVGLMAKIGGLVILEAVVGTDGRVKSVIVLRSVKFLDVPAMDAVKQWQYSPLMLNGIASEFVLTVILNFRTQNN